MSANWSEYLALAEHLHATSIISPETSERTAISRAYYAAFNLAADRLEAKREWHRGKVAGDHKELAGYLRRFGSTAKGRAGKTLDRLYYYRCRADYDGELHEPAKLAETSIIMAREIVASLPSF